MSFYHRQPDLIEIKASDHLDKDILKTSLGNFDLVQIMNDADVVGTNQTRDRCWEGCTKCLLKNGKEEAAQGKEEKVSKIVNEEELLLNQVLEENKEL